MVDSDRFAGNLSDELDISHSGESFDKITAKSFQNHNDSMKRIVLKV